MSSKADKIAMQKLKDAHMKKYGVELGKRMCRMKISKDCLNIADEDKFRGHQCKACVKHDQHERVTAKLKAQGLTRVGRGNGKKKAKDSDTESD